MSAEENSDISENNNNDEELIEIEDVPGVVLHPPTSVLRFVNSPVWKFFDFVGTKDGPDLEKKKVKCKHCKYAVSFTSSTSALSHHVTRWHKKLYDKLKNKIRTMSSQFKGFLMASLRDKFKA